MYKNQIGSLAMKNLLSFLYPKYRLKLSYIKYISSFPIIFLYGCATIYEGSTTYIDDKECLSCGSALVWPFKWEKRCNEIPKYARERLKEMMGEQYPKSCEEKDLHE